MKFDGKDISRLLMVLRRAWPRRRLPAAAAVFKQLSVENNLMAILETLPGLSRAERKKRQDKLLDQFGLTHVRKTMANRVSGGERRRVEIARSLVTDPKLIMLDEPFAAIDPKTVSEIQDVIRDLAKTYGIGILLTDHSVERVLESSDRSYLIHDGLVVVSGTSETILESKQARDVYLGNRIDYAHILQKRPVHALGTGTRPPSEPVHAAAPAQPVDPDEPDGEAIGVVAVQVPINPLNYGPGTLTDRAEAPIAESKPTYPPQATEHPETVFDIFDPEGPDLGMEIPDALVVPPKPPAQRPVTGLNMDTFLGGSVVVTGDMVIEQVEIFSNTPNPNQPKDKPRGSAPGQGPW